MKHLLLSAALLCAGSTAMQAQDTSTWKPGDNISEFLEWGDYDGSVNEGTYWQGTGAAYDFQEWEIFQGQDVDRYQIVHLPAGVYTFKAQAFYRDGGAEDAFKHYWAGQSLENAKLYADLVTAEETEDEEGGTTVNYVVSRSYETPIRSNWSEEITNEIYVTYEDNGDRNWMSDSYYKNDNGTEYYAPNSMAGARAWFDRDYFWNELKVIVFEDGDVKLGIRKPGSLGSDWILFSNFQIIYQGDAGEAAEMELALEDFQQQSSKALARVDAIMEEYGSLGAFYFDEIAELEEAGNTVEEIRAATEAVKALIAKYEGYYSVAKQLSTAIKYTEGLMKMPTYGETEKAALQAAIDEAKRAESDGNSMDEPILTSPEDYADAFNALLAARTTFVLSKGANESGYYDATDLIAFPWICNMEYNPTFDEETGRWNHSDVVLTDAGWGEKNDCDGTDRPSGEAQITIASDVVLSKDSTITNGWYLKGEYTSGGSPDYVTYWNDWLTCAKAWSMPFIGWYEMRQKITGIPNGYYSLKAFGATWSNDWGQNGNPTCMNHIYAKTDNTKVSSGYVEPSGWWGNDQANRDWRELETPMIQVTDGTLTISSSANGFSAFTGFRLTYYGENPDFTAMIASQIELLNTEGESKLILDGDKKAIADILAKIPETIVGFNTYNAALSTIAEARDYMNAAYDYMNNWSTIEDYTNLQNYYNSLIEEGETSEEATILDVPYMYVLTLGSEDTDTYLKAKAAANDYNAYAHYLESRMKIKGEKAVANDEALKAMLNSQYAYLVENYADTEKLNEFEQELAKPYNAALLASLDIKNASELNPVDITVLVTNPSYTNNKNGWNGDFTVDAQLQNAECYNMNFDVNQTIYALPAGAYMVEVQSYYRDGGMGDTTEGAYYNWWYEAGGDIEAWSNPNVKLYAASADSERATTVLSIANETQTEPSFTTYVTDSVDIDEDEQGNLIYEYTYADIDLENPVFPFDAKVTDIDVAYWYPNSMRGAFNVFNNNKDAYINRVQIMVNEGENLTFGLRKRTTVNSDWCMFDNWKLYYLGTAVPTGIDSVAQEGEVAKIQYFSVNGTQLNAPVKGINIVKTTYKNGTVKTVKMFK